MNQVVFRQNLVEQINSIQKSCDSIFKSPKAEEFNRRITEKKWSVAEHIDHMNRTIKEYFRELDLCEVSKNTNLNKDEYNPRFFGRMFIGLLEPPPKIKLKTFNVFMPSKQLDLSEIENDFKDLRQELIGRVNNAVDDSTLTSKLNSPLSKLIKFEVGEAFMILTAHDRRHIYSVNKIIEQL